MVCVSTAVTHQQPTHNEDTQPLMNKSCHKQCAYFKKFLQSQSACPSTRWNDDPMDNVHSWACITQAFDSIDFYSNWKITAAYICIQVHTCPSMRLFEMEMTLPFTMCITVTCGECGADNYATGCIMKCTRAGSLFTIINPLQDIRQTFYVQYSKHVTALEPGKLETCSKGNNICIWMLIGWKSTSVLNIQYIYIRRW